MPAADSPESLEAALARLAGGDANGLEQVYRLSAPRVLAICLRILGDRGEAEDVVHDTYLRLAANAGRYNGARGSAIGWLVTIARNLSIDRLRSRTARGQAMPVSAAEDLPDPAPLADQALLAGETTSRINGCLGTLDEVQEGAIRSAFFTGRTYAQLADERGVPLGTMKSWVRRGLARLKECLDQ
ncbi:MULTISPECIES: sigma-70 family RNA polymerase sigma factor [unclassified Novosphingobium]|uniref:sigma-70 family RNA polymerase sigma factor n=1 Tax=unclassified Novosphingobium TaxID=2644732 RepID=UPI0025F42553|nr:MULTISPECIES: sigma-70 family RNA polymerase sigma factor [unclassified Novosphingobium]HQV03097.1 sigma-70 family RNA polymerase sigma factor [Novosphingobium sp.]